MSIVLDQAEIARALKRIAHEIIERNKGVSNLVIIGIPTRGSILAARLTKILSSLEGVEIHSGSLDTTMYRDDLRNSAPRSLGKTEIPLSGVHDRDVVLVDDVLFSGRTIRAALDALSEHGRPKTVQLAVLIDRGHRELPIRADYVGKNLPTNRNERVQVCLSEIDDLDQVEIEGRA
jgi:pyrimidine operon attenuation protein/uracil phosphoribosyltransferase